MLERTECEAQESAREASVNLEIFNVQFLNTFYTNVNLDEFLQIVDECISEGTPRSVVSLNVDQVVKCDRDVRFREAFNNADFVLMDGVPLIKYAQHKGLSVKEKLSGSDLMLSLCEHAADKGYTCYFFGGKEGVPEEAARRLQEQYSGLKVVGCYSPPYGFEKSEELIEESCDRVARVSPDFCFVCLGEPKQTLFVQQHMHEYGAKLSFCFGAAVDFAAGNVKRAPAWMQTAGLEWLYRFLKEPKRLFRRYFVDSWRLLAVIKRYPVVNSAKNS